MKKELLKIIDNSDEALFELDSYLSVQNEASKEEVWSSLKEIALYGTQKQRFVALTVISVNEPPFLEAFSTELIKNRNFSEVQMILKPIINICALVEKEIHIRYMQDVLEYALKTNNGYLAEVTIRNFITTKYWTRISDNLSQIVTNSDNQTITDMLAFFVNERGIDEYQSFVQSLSKDNQEKLTLLHDQITNRLKSYQKLNGNGD